MEENSRLKTIRRLSQNFEIKNGNLTKEDIYLENLESNYIPTIGCEIEIPWRAVLDDYDSWFNEKYSEFSKEKKKAFDERCNSLDKKLKPLYEKATNSGVPKGYDAYHEFANSPVNWYKTLSEELRILTKAGLIPEEKSLPLHITLGGIKLDKDSGVAASIVELSGGSNLERLISPEKNYPKWDRNHTEGGIRERGNLKIKGRYSGGIEIRTLVAENFDQIERTLKTAQLLYSSVRAYQNQSPKDKTNNELKSTWELIYKNVVDEFLTPNGLNKWWQRPSENKTEWERFGSFFNRLESEKLKSKIREYESKIEEILKNKN